MAKAPILLPRDRRIEEENVPGYCAERFLQVHPGDVLGGKYEVIAKLGFGQSSTVWLTRELSGWFWQDARYFAVKVQTAELDTDEAAARVKEIEQRLTRSPEHHGYGFVRRASHPFTVEGEAGQKHLCQAFEPARQPIAIWQARLPDGKIPGPLLKVYIRFILLGLDYLHNECQMVHTDLSRSNIMMGFEDDAVLPEFVKSLSQRPIAQKVTNERTVYHSQFDFGPLKGLFSTPQIHDFGNAALMREGFACRHPIQPDLYRAPEVMLGIPWSYKVDIWNLCVLIWELLEGVDLFTQVRNGTGRYSTRAHLANMIALLGSPPSSLLQQERECRDTPLPYEVTDDEGKTHRTFAGPFFLEDGEGLSLADSITTLDGEDKLAFIDFAKQMLCWSAEDRKTAAELLTHPWLVNKR
ncbi:hypothetical protein CERZMDRAFT_111056 [Cercospora zeae-maydis SCOH1-5]|uniref:EKC/KEOPS complex subunit BUD32 n=1 Tax=Cercospora zeae-maydis SCOH1-5 TaxID=717836 RepID=A0A6A6FLR2_9PEZI|nr:hypothetical protein CERZMDRAFT_111056 [Cercospora zeae-maydis SCOH1-5]